METILQLIEEKIDLGQSLVDKIEQDFIEIDGAVKTKRNIEKEIKFLQKVRRKIFLKVEKIVDTLFVSPFSSNPNVSVVAMRWT